MNDTALAFLGIGLGIGTFLGPEAVEAAVARRGLERSLVAARPERWPLPSRNGSGGRS
jgi:hypothetical protein